MAGVNDWPWQRWAAERGQHRALLIGEEPYNWQQLSQQVETLASGFRQQGVMPGCGVALCGKNSAEMLFGYLALLRCGARLLPLNPALPETLVSRLLPSLDIDFAWSESGRNWPASIQPLQQQGAASVSLPGWQRDRWATLTLTSGTRGLPKAVLHNPAAHLASAAGVLSRMDYRQGDCWLLSLPLFHVSGQGILWRWLLAGATLALRPQQPLHTALQGCTHASLVPTQLWRLLAQSQAWPLLKEVLLGGAAIPHRLTAQAQDAGIRCWCGYGMTETASTVCMKLADALPGVGHPLPGKALKQVAGEIWLQSDSLGLGYWQRGTVLPLVDDSGWFHTRDRGVLEPGGWQILGRLDNLFFSGGEGIQPEEIEQVLLLHPGIEQAYVLPQDDAEFGQRPVALLALREGVTFREVDLWLRDKVAGFQRPAGYYALPATLLESGIKISRQQLQRGLQAQKTPEPE